MNCSAAVKEALINYAAPIPLAKRRRPTRIIKLRVRGGALDPKIAIDIEVLEGEQAERSAGMRRAIDHRAEYFSWDEVRAAIAVISS